MKFQINTIKSESGAIGAIDIEIRPGEKIVFIGANGTGKSRLGYYIERELFRKTTEGHKQIRLQVEELEKKLDQEVSQLDTALREGNEKLDALSTENGNLNETEVQQKISLKESIKSNITSLTNQKEEILQGKKKAAEEVAEFDPNAAFNFDYCQRVSALRSLVVPPHTPYNSYKYLREEVLYGGPDTQNNTDRKWKKLVVRGHHSVEIADGVGTLQQDFATLIGALIANKLEISTKYIDSGKSGSADSILDHVFSIWNRLLPDRKISLNIEDRSIELKTANGSSYNLIDSSEGERTIFYILGQCILYEKKSLIIIDEPDLYIHESIIEALYDTLEEELSDCAFIYITHNLGFATSRHGKKYSLFGYKKEQIPSGGTNQKEYWDITELPKSNELPEKIKTHICGSRKPVLFVEGDENQRPLDRIYRSVYPNMEVLHVGACSQVINYTKGANGIEQFHRIQCFGIVDGDNRERGTRRKLEQNQVYCLDIAIIENAFLIPNVAKALYDLLQVDYCKEKFIEDIIAFIDEDENWIADNVKDNLLKDLKSQINSMSGSIKELSESHVNVPTIASEVSHEKAAVDNIMSSDKDPEKILRQLLAKFRCKSLFAHLARLLGLGSKEILKEKILHAMNNKAPLCEKLIEELKKELPEIDTTPPQ